MLSSFTAYLLLTDLLVTAALYVWFEAFQRKQMTKRGKRRAQWFLILVSVLLAPFVVLQIGLAGCVLALQFMALNKGAESWLNNLVNFAPFLLWALLAMVIAGGLWSMRRQGTP